MIKHKNLIVLLLLVLIAQILFGMAIYFSLDRWPDRGTFGDMFGAVNCLFSGLAFAGVIYAIFLQGQELELQREELALTRNELMKSAKYQHAQAETMRKAAQINALSTLIETYTLISTRYGSMGSRSTVLAKEKSESLVTELENYLSEFDSDN